MSIKLSAFFCFFIFSGFLIVAHTAHSQEFFSSGDSGTDETFSGGDPDGGPSDGGPEHYDAGRLVGPNFRPLPGYTNCGPWYNSYKNFVQAMMRHYGGMCEVRNGNQVWCHGRFPGNCNPDATGGRPDSPIVDTGVRYTPLCQSVCDRTVAEGGHYTPTPTTIKPVLSEKPPPCDMPSLEDLALPPDDGDVAVALALPPEGSDIGGDVAVAQALTPDGSDIGGDVAVALALPEQTTLTGGVSKVGVFIPPPQPKVLQGKATINGWPIAPDQQVTLQGNATQTWGRVPQQKPVKLQGYATKSLRIPATYKPKNPKPKTTSPQTDTQIQLVLHGDVGSYSADIGKERFIAGFLQGMADEMKHQTRYGETDKITQDNDARKKKEKDARTRGTCEIKGEVSPVFEDAVKHPEKNPGGAGKFVTDMIEKVFQYNEDLGKTFPQIEKMLKFLGPILSGADMLHTYKETLETIVDRDDRIKQAMANSKGHDIDPRDVGYLAGQDAADAYSYMVKNSFSLGFGFDPKLPH